MGTKVTVSGKIAGGKLRYDSITPYVHGQAEEIKEHRLKVDLEPEAEEIWLNKMPPSPSPKPFDLTLEVEWPYRSIWKGICPTSQIYDFFVEFDGECIWQWSSGKSFLQALTPVAIPGGSRIPSLRRGSSDRTLFSPKGYIPFAACSSHQVRRSGSRLK